MQLFVVGAAVLKERVIDRLSHTYIHTKHTHTHKDARVHTHTHTQATGSKCSSVLCLILTTQTQEVVDRK